MAKLNNFAPILCKILNISVIKLKLTVKRETTNFLVSIPVKNIKVKNKFQISSITYWNLYLFITWSTEKLSL